MSLLTVDANAQSDSVLRLIDSTKIFVTSPRLLSSAKLFLALEGERNKSIIVEGGDVSEAAERVGFRSGARADAVTFR